MKPAVTAFALIALLVLVFAGLGSNQTLYRSPIHDIGYNNIWAANVPEVVAGHRVLGIFVRKGGCRSWPIIALETPAELMDGSLRDWPAINAATDKLERELQSIPGFPKDIDLSLSLSQSDKEGNLAGDRQWNGTVGEIECITFGQVGDLNLEPEGQ